MSDKLKAALDRIAAMKAEGIADADIAETCGIEESTLVAVYEKDEFKEAVGRLKSDKFDTFQTMNTGWDMIENFAMNKVIEHLQKMPDPDYALRAAAMANKAQRRGKSNNAPIHASPNQQVTIILQQGFADRLAKGVVLEHERPDAKTMEKKDNNFMPPKKVQNLLKSMKPQSLQDQVESEFGDLLPAMS